MSQANVEIVRRVYEAAARRDSTTVFALYDPGVELDSSRLRVVDGDGIYRGHDGLRSFFRQWHDAWDGIDYDYDDLIDGGEETVVAVVTRHGRGQASGVWVEKHVALVRTIREQRVARVVWFPTRAEALEAVGLSE